LILLASIRVRVGFVEDWIIIKKPQSLL